MKAFVKVKPESGGAEYSDLDVPRIGPEDVLIEVKAAGICGTDIHLYDWTDNIVREYKPKLPLVMGHEFAGLVIELGHQVIGLKKGDKVSSVLLNTSEDMRHIITHRIPLERAAEGFQLMKDLEGMKIILEP